MGLGAIGAFTAAWRPAVTGTDFQKTARKKQWDTGVSDKERPHNQAQVDTPSTLSDPSHINHAALRHSRSPGNLQAKDALNAVAPCTKASGHTSTALAVSHGMCVRD